MKLKKYLLCPIDDCVLREIDADDLKSLPLFELCDICGIEHRFEDAEIANYYNLVKFSKNDGVDNEMEIMRTYPEMHSLDERDVQALSDTMPILGYLSNVVENKPFEGKRFIAVLHFLKDLIPFIDSLEKLGLNPTETLLFYKEYSYPHKDQIIKYLKSKGYLLASVENLNETLMAFQERCKDQEKPIIIIEDGGYLVPAIHNPNYSDLKAQTIGAVEQTTKGERQDLDVKDLAFPVLSIAKSNLKMNFEPPHVARAVVMNIKRLISHVNFNSREVLLIGYGDIGKEIASQLRDVLRMNVTIFDLDTSKLLKAQQEGFKTCKHLDNCVHGKFLIIGATGVTSIGRNELLSMEHNVYLVSSSSDQREIGLQELHALSSSKEALLADGNKIGTKFIIRGMQKSINLIADGYPINFWAEESMPNNVSDLIMSLIYISTIEITQEFQSIDKKVLTDKVNELERKYELSDLYLEYHS